jgi:glutathione S-transferase
MFGIILHHYEFSPYSEKVRLVFGLKRLPWRSVLMPVWMPKPELTPLTGGYRRAPVMQIGADVYCDTQLILRVLDRLHPEPSLFPGGTEGIAPALSFWWESNTFLTAARVLGAMMGDKLPPELVEDRKSFLGFDMGRAAMAPHLPVFIDRLRAHFHWPAGMFGDGRPFVLGAAPSAADFSAYHIIWLLRRNLGADIDALVPFARLDGWYERVGAFGHGAREEMPAAEALAVAAGATPAPPLVDMAAPAHGGEAFGLVPGRRVSVTPDDTGRDPVAGALVAAGPEFIVLRREDPRLGTVHVHFPRAGYDAVPA